MANRDLTYSVAVDASDAVSGLRKLEGAVRSTMRSVEDELDEGANAGEKLAASLDRVAAQAKEDLASAAIAAEALQDALKRAGSTMDVGDALASLTRMGVTMDEVTQEADRLAVSLKGLEDVRAAGVADLDSIAPGLATKLDDVSRSADSSKSALANMVGNSAQDLGDMAGVAGSAGVAIGQMAEYFADAAFEGEGLGSVLKSFAGVALPIAGLALATQTLGQVMSRFSDSTKRTAANVEAWEDALAGGGDASENYADSLRDLGKVVLDVTRSQSTLMNVTGELSSHWYTTGLGVDVLSRLLGASGDETRDLTKTLAQAGVTVERWTSLIEAGGAETAAFVEYLKTTNLTADEQADILAGLAQQQTDHAKAAANDAVATAFFGEESEESAKSVEELAEEQAAAVKAAREHEVAMTDAAAAMAELSSTFAEMGRRGDALSSVFDLGNAPLAAAAATRDIDEDIAGLTEAAKGVNIGDVLAGNMNGDAVLDALDTLRPQIQAKVTEAFAAGGPEAATQVGADYVAQIVEALGGKLTAEEVANLLGLSDLEATVKVALDMSTAARVRTMLDVLTGLNGETPLTASIALALEAGTISPEAAEVLVRAQLGQAKVSLPTDVTPPSPEDLAEAGAFVSAQVDPIPLPTSADPQGFARGAADIAADDYAPATVPVEADPTPAEDTVDDFTSERRTTNPVTVDASTAAAALVILAFLSLPRKANVYVDVPNANAADAVLDAVAAPRRAPINATLDDYPTSSEIVRAVTGGAGVIRVPVDTYLRNTVRIEGAG